MEVEVTWECANYDTETEERSYTFVPKWDEAEWSFKETEENRIPTVEVVYTEPGSEVSTEEELAAAFAAGLGQITLKNDIFLTKPLKLPAAAKIELDGKGFSLFRGTTTADDGSSSEFTGVMICMDGADYTDGTYGRLTLKDIIVDGKTETADHAGAPAILDKGELILETGAVVTNNDNHGTSPEADGEGVEEILPYGGGIQVYGKLTVMEGSSITKNRAEERGGGVYLFSGSMLELYADVIKDNSVGLVGGKQYGADLYAEEGSRIYFDPSIDMDRPEFYICEGVIPSPQKPPADAARKELYIYVNEDSGYTSSQIAELKAELGKMGYIVLEGRTDIDTTDLQDWYVYDHYDTNCWSEEEWKAEGGYGDNEKRKYYPYTAKNSSYYHFPGGTDDPEGKNVTTIEAWLDNPDYGTGRNRYLAQFKEHIYVRPDPKGSALMTFVGYGEDPLVDFMYYDPKSDGEKVVDFDVDSTVVDTHTLLGNGFLVNTGVDENGNLSGYLVLYTYSGQNASALILYRVQGQADRLHQGPLSSTTREITRIGINGSDWKDLMSVQIRVTPNKIAVRQQPQDQGTDISKAAPILEYDIPAGDVSGYSGFGPLVAYGSHGCSDASSFTYSDLRMYYTNPRLAGTNMLSPVEKADFTQVGMQKYFVDLFGGSGYYFNEMDRGDLYHEYMKMMQTEGIALVTDRKTPFAPYLGEANGSDSNLFELGTGGPLPNPKELAQRIHNSISSKGSTELEEKVEQGALTEPSPKGSVGNIWLKSVETGEQIRETLYGNDFPDSGYQIQVIDDSDIAYYHEGATGVTYEILKPKAKDYETLGLSTAPSQYPITIPKGGQADWPAGFYTVRQKVDGSGVDGYAYFTLEWRDTPIPTYTVTVKVNKDGEEWPDHGKDFWLRPSAGGSMIRPSGAVTAGNYGVYERVKFPYSQDINTGVSVEVKNLPKTVTVDYYTVTFYDGPPSPEQEPNAYGDNTAQKRQYVLKTGRVSQPANPAKDRHNFTGWINENGENFDFRNTAIQEPGTKIYATWDRIIYPVAVGLKVQKDGSEWSDHGKEFRLRPEGSDTPVKVSEMKQFSDKLFAGKYAVYDVTGLSEDDIPEDGRDTGRSVEVTAEDTEDPATAPKEVTVDYYTVTFYDGPFSPEQEPNAYGDDTAWKPQIVLAGTGVDQSLVDKIPTKDKHEFSGWVNKDGEKLDLLNVTINGTTGVYAEWDRMKYPVTVGLKVQKDDEEWNGHGKEFRLCPKGGDAPVKVSEMKPFTEKAATVSAGTYTVYDVTGLNEDDVPGNDRDTGCSVEVTVEDTENSDTQPKEVTVDYYTVTFYDGLPSSDQKPEPYGKDTDWKEQTVLKGKPAVCPAAKPEKDKYAFLGWASAEEKGFNFNEGIRGTTGIYAMWEKIEEPRYKVTVNARRDGGGWEDAGRIFALRPEGGEQFISNLDEVKAGTYRIYDITGGSPVSRASRAVEAPVNVKVDDGDTGITVTVADGNVTRDVDYYTVTFYDGKNAYGTDTSQSPLIVLGGKTAAEPEASPDKKGYRFTGWFTADDGKTAFDFAQAIRNKTDIYAGWKANRKEPPKEKKPEPEDTPGGGDTRIVTVSQEAAPQNGTVQTASAQTPEEPASGTGEPRTGDTTQIQIYATVAMIAGLTYLLLYFMEESRGMTEREKEVFVAAFIRWAKKGGRFRRCCAIVAIFCILVYYHSIGKRAGRNSVDREYLKQAL